MDDGKLLHKVKFDFIHVCLHTTGRIWDESQPRAQELPLDMLFD
jgi:hypothetical protein